MSTENKDQKEKLMQLMRDAVKHDDELRAKYQIGEKFRFIRDRLNALLSRVEESLAELQQKTEERSDKISEDEVLVYVYLYNAQGLVLKTWQKMLNPAVFYEHSINRPIYTDKSHIEAYIRSKANKVQHGYLTIAVKKTDMVKSTEPLQDAMSHPLIKVKEGSLHFNRLISFTHGNNDYVVNEEGDLVKKD